MSFAFMFVLLFECSSDDPLWISHRHCQHFAGDCGLLRPAHTILGALEESIARRTREGRIWPAFLDQFWIERRSMGPMQTGPTVRGHRGAAKPAELLHKVD
jgi:hypothetical protein